MGQHAPQAPVLNWRLPRRIYMGEGIWSIEPEEAQELCAKGVVEIDGREEPVRGLGSKEGRAIVRVGDDDSPYRAYCDSDLRAGEVRTA